uniref:Alpha-macroglobulin receptor-binding domain-containing protein n=1 Tax=Amphilophus citrinellus TaxID=61819 RepID=A0A3Q0RX32_AMPCI
SQNLKMSVWWILQLKIIEAGAETRFCASLLQPSETLVMTVTLRSTEENTTLLTHTSNEEFHTCTEFQAPLVEREKILNFEVELRGDTFHSKQVRKVMIKAYKAKTFVQTDKPIYLPGQTGKSDTYFHLYLHVFTLNRIGQWLNESSNSKILQLSYSLNSEAREGMYSIIVSGGEDKLYHNFKVEKYVLPKFDVTVNVSEEVSIGQEEFDIKLCAKYTYGQPVPGSVTVKVCRPLQFYSSIDKSFNLTNLSRKTSTGCAAVTFKMSTFTRIDQKILDDTLNVNVKMEEEGTGKTYKSYLISYSLGKVSFIDMSKLWEPGSNVEGKVSTKCFLSALALYSTLVFSPEGSSTVTVQTPSSQLTFDVNQDNKLLYQEKTMQDVSGKYSLDVKGTACASVYSGKENTTNMVILDIKMLSGFVPDAQSLKRVSYYSYYFQLNRNVLPKDTPINHSLEIIQELPVDNLKPAVVKIYDYYQPSDQAETEYIYPGTSGSKL